MVYPVYENTFKVGAAAASLKTVADCTSFSVSLDNGVEEWNPMDTQGWTRRLMTAKSVTVTLNCKRNYGDQGNDFLAGLAWENGTDANGAFEWTMPDGGKITFNCVFNVTALAGESTDPDALEVEVLSDGAVTYTAPTP